MLLEKLKNYALLIRIDKPIGILLLLWPTLWALWLATRGHPSFKLIFIFVIGVILMRSAGCIINDFADRHVDGKVARTKHRPLVTKKVSLTEAFVLFFLICASSFILVLFLNKLTIELALVGAALAVFYPFMKRFTSLPQVGLGAAFSWGIPMVFAAANNQVSYSAWILFLTAFIWPVIYDTYYAMTDKDDDVSAGIKSTAILFGGHAQIILSVLQCLFLILLCVVGKLFHLQIYFYLSLCGVFILFCYQQYLIYLGSPTFYFKAFLNSHWVGFLIFVGIFLSYLI